MLGRGSTHTQWNEGGEEGGEEGSPGVLPRKASSINEVLIIPEEEGAFCHLEVMRAQAFGNEAEECLPDLR